MSRLIPMKNNFRADYTYTVEDNVIAIVDLDQGGKSLTNDIENVLDDIRRELGSTLSGYAVIYRDSLGVWDGVRLTERGNVDFYRLNESDPQAAASRLLHPLP